MTNFRILHIEDDYQFSLALRQAVAPYGIEIEHYFDVIEGLKAFQANPRRYTAVLCDGSPSGSISAVNVIKELKETDPSVPIIAQSNFDQELASMFNEGAYVGIGRQTDDDHARGLLQALNEIKARFVR